MQSLNRAFTGLFAIALIVFLLLAFVLVIVQVSGLVGGQPAWIDWGAEHITQPSIVAAILTGIFGFAAFNARPQAAKSTEDDEGD